MDNAKKNYFKNHGNIIYCKNKYDTLDNSLGLILLTEWPEFRSPDFDLIKEKLLNPLIFDGRNQFIDEHLFNKGFEYFRIGKKND